MWLKGVGVAEGDRGGLRGSGWVKGVRWLKGVGVAEGGRGG